MNDNLKKAIRDRNVILFVLGLVPASNGRVLKIESLDDNERKYAQILDEYLRICFMDEQIEELINCIKMIQFNIIYSKNSPSSTGGR